jgi:hypothetical protein
MTIDEMRAKARRDICGKCFGAVGDGCSCDCKITGCMLDRVPWMCAGPYAQGELYKIVDDEEDAV